MKAHRPPSRCRRWPAGRPWRGLVLAAWLLAATPAALWAAPLPPPDPKPAAPLPAAAPAPTRQPAPARLRQLRAERELQYLDLRVAPEHESLWLRFLRWLFELIASIRNTQGGRIAWNTVFYALMAGILVYAVLKFLKVDLTRMFGRSSRQQALGYDTGTENIHELDFVDAIEQAEAAGNLRLALRLGYLRVLKQLTDQALIDWQPDKTNQTYLRELTANRADLRPAFAALTRQFEYVWYGEWPLETASYQPLREGQQQFGQALGAVVRW